MWVLTEIIVVIYITIKLIEILRQQARRHMVRNNLTQNIAQFRAPNQNSRRRRRRSTRNNRVNPPPYTSENRDTTITIPVQNSSEIEEQQVQALPLLGSSETVYLECDN